MRYPAYSEYKESGVQWLGNLPKEWNVKKIKYLAIGKDTLFLDGDWIESKDIVYDKDQIRYITTGNIGLGKYREQGDTYITAETFQELHCTELFPGDLIISRLNMPMGRACILPDLKKCVVTSVDNVVLRPSLEYNKAYLVFAMSSHGYIEYNALMARGTTMQRMSRSLLGNVVLPIPSLSEQTAIADFLDREAGRIDALVAKKRRLIELLREKRTALVSRTVTRGLPADAAREFGLEPHTRFKDSGIDWLGEVPEGWVVKKLGYGAWLQGGYAFASDKFDSEGVPVIRMNNLKRGVLDISQASCIASENCMEEFALKAGDLLYGMSGSIGETGSLGNFARIRECVLPAQLNQRVGRFVVIDKQLTLDFLVYVIQTKLFYDQILLSVTGTAQFNVSSAQVQSVIIPYPSLSEQSNIAIYLDRETSKIDRLVEKVEAAVGRLQEYRTALITAAVTGKIDVREAVA